jgi:hypothetical protein
VAPVAELTATAPCTGYRAVVETTGELVGQRHLAKRVGWAAGLIRQLAEGVVAACWSEADLDLLAGGVDQAGRRLPAKGWMALRRLGWTATAPAGVYVSDRVRRAAEEAAARALRLALRRRAIIMAVVASWPSDPYRRTETEWAALRTRLPTGTTRVEIRNRTRQLRAWAGEHAGRLPLGLTELEPPPRVAKQVLLAAADKQLVTMTRDSGQTARLRVQLPLTAASPSTADWAWHAIDLRLPPTVPAGAALQAPTLRVADANVRVDVPFTQPIPPAQADGHTVALGLDWGVNTLLTGSLGCLTADRRVYSDGRRLGFDATAASAKLQRLRRNRETVAARRDHHTAVLSGLPSSDDGTDLQRQRLRRKLAVLQAEHERICDRIRHLNHALAWAAARWAVDQALALGASVIYLEDLATLEARGRRGTANARLAGQVRGTVADAVRHLAAKAGIAAVTVPARGTSKGCPRCLRGLHHAPAPDRAGRHGWRWSVCQHCGLSCDRDHAAAERIVARGLLGQAHTVTDPTTGSRSIRTTIDGPVARARQPRRPRRQTRSVRRRTRRSAPHPRGPATTPGKGHPTPTQPTRTAAPPTTSRRVPDRRAVPAPTAGRIANPAAGKRPAGPVPQTRPHPRVRARSGPARDRLHQPGRMRSGAAWGFHRTVRATDVVLLDGWWPADRTGHVPPGMPESLRQP